MEHLERSMPEGYVCAECGVDNGDTDDAGLCDYCNGSAPIIPPFFAGMVR